MKRDVYMKHESSEYSLRLPKCKGITNESKAAS